jgi:hypothetical protein
VGAVVGGPGGGWGTNASRTTSPITSLMPRTMNPSSRRTMRSPRCRSSWRTRAIWWRQWWSWMRSPWWCAMLPPPSSCYRGGTPNDSARSLIRCSSTMSQIHWKFTLLQSPSSSRRSGIVTRPRWSKGSAGGGGAGGPRAVVCTGTTRLVTLRRVFRGLRFINSSTTGGGSSTHATPTKL